MQEFQSEELRDTIQFHGHLCPGLALGFRVAKAALRELTADRPNDEELVAVVENDSCAVDAIQFIAGCTFGKGNLIFLDHGKHVYTFFNRGTGKGIRIAEDFRVFDEDERYLVLKKKQDAGEEESREMDAYKMAKVAAILDAEEKDFLQITPVTTLPPQEARIRTSVRCSVCNEKFMESRGRSIRGGRVCIPCGLKLDLS